MAKDKLQQLADELEEVMDFRSRMEAEIAPIKEREEKIRELLTQSLLKKGFKYVKTTSGLGFGIVDGRKTYTIVKGREQEAIQWAQKDFPGLLAINKPDLAKVLKPMLTIPEFFEEKVGEPHLSVRNNEDEAPLMPQK